MSTRDYARKRIDAFLKEIDLLKEGDFPYAHSKEALEKIAQVYRNDLHDLDSIDDENDTATINRACVIALQNMFRFLPLMGFVLRSTNVRNAFEVYRPLLRLAADVLEPSIAQANRKTRLLLSSEWQYSPFIYKEVLSLSDFVLIGLPAPESANPFLVPLAGHELGHRVWTKRQVAQTLKSKIQQVVENLIFSRWSDFQQVSQPQGIPQAPTVADLFVLASIDTTATITRLQAEESFCDFLGLRIFGTSYLNAFSYLLSPKLHGHRSFDYPNILRRVENLLQASLSFDVTVPDNYLTMFEDQPEPKLLPKDGFYLSVADAALQVLVPELIDLAKQAVTEAGIPLPSDSKAEVIHARLTHMVPAQNCECLADILNAGWIAFPNDELWSGLIPSPDLRLPTLKELILKNIEVFEIEQIVKEQP